VPSAFHDHFSGHATDYARYRPDYPAALFDWLAATAPSRGVAWDCATGNGQAASSLARRFERVVATDASVTQVRQGRPGSSALYAVATAEEAPLPAASVDLVTVAQALHWFDRTRFWAEATRALVPGGLMAVWYYDLLEVTPEVDAVVRRLYSEVVGPYWPPERLLIEAGYATLEFPFEEIVPPPFRMEKEWALVDLEGYLRTWSATRRFAEARHEDPVLLVADELRRAWGEPARSRTAGWEVHIRAGRRQEPGEAARHARTE
jgi:SAM-dependent methyltransferase